MKENNVIAIDLGASSGRLIHVVKKGDKIYLDEIYRFANEGIRVGERFYTDILYLYHEIICGLQKAVKKIPMIDSIAIDSWGVDFGLLDKNGELLGNPYHYRDEQSQGMIEKANEIFGNMGLYAETGIQDMWYNTVYALLGIRERNQELLDRASTFLMIPDILTYFLTGEKKLEYTGVSTTQLYRMQDKKWSDSILKNLKLSENIFPEVLQTGSLKGHLTGKVKELIGIHYDIPVIATAQHDSASAAYGVPAEDNYLFVNSGTWSIIGMVIDHPILTEEVFKHELSNEGAAYGKVKLVKTIMGMWLIQELRKCWSKDGKNIDYNYLIEEAEKSVPFSHLINVDDELFVSPINMESAINEYLLKNNQSEITSQGEFYRTVMESLAFKYKEALISMEKLTNNKVDTIYLLGGTVQDKTFCQFIANATGKKVSGGPIEATAVGNAMIQLKSLGAIRGDKEVAEIIKNSFDIAVYEPQNVEAWEEQYKRYKELV